MNTRSLLRLLPLLFGIWVLGFGISRAQESGQAPKPWTGIAMVRVDLGEGAPDGATCGVRAVAVVPGSPAAKAGVKAGDVIVAADGRPLDADPKLTLTGFKDRVVARKVGDTFTVKVLREDVEATLAVDGKPVEPGGKPAWRDLAGFMDEAPAGTAVELSARKTKSVLEIAIVLEAAPPNLMTARKLPPNAELLPGFDASPTDEEEFARAVIAEASIVEPCDDLFKRLAKTEVEGDPWRLGRAVYVHRDPWRMEAVASAMERELAAATDPAAWSAVRIVETLASWKDAPLAAVSPAAPAAALKTGLDFEGHANQIADLLAEARKHHEAAFAALSADERAALEKGVQDASDVLASSHVLSDDEDAARRPRTREAVRLAAKVDFRELLAAARIVARLLEPEFLEALRKDLSAAAGADLEKPILFEKETPVGWIVFGGEGRAWHKDRDAAAIVDLGGNDFYTNNAGAATGFALPAAIVVDFDGDDAYEASRDVVQGGGRLGVGALVDLAGNDAYLGGRWCQGTAALGVGLLIDVAGDDTYRCQEFGQGCALWGAAALVDLAGADRYEGIRYAQAVSLAGVGVAADRAGDDRWFAKGRYPTGYGDPGLFDAWSQGCAMGIRGETSGGIAFLYDSAGADAFEAGHFSQGGGYFYGWGIQWNGGPEDDSYLGSRYAQGFAAHQACGFFFEEAGNDRYSTRQSVAQGLSWDETSVVFVDAAGDDSYEGMGGFSQGASAQNGFCLFLDRDGSDRYRPGGALAPAGGNDYHGGSSLSVFLDLGSGEDEFGNPRPDGTRLLDEATIAVYKEYGLRADLPEGPHEALADDESFKRRLRLDLSK